MEKNRTNKPPKPLAQPRCVRCGEDLTHATAVRSTKKWLKKDGYYYLCKSCQGEYYDVLAKETSPALALFFCCVSFNVPFVSNCVPKLEGEEGNAWVRYLQELEVTKENTTNRNSVKGFKDGETDIVKVFGEGLKSGYFTKEIAVASGNECFDLAAQQTEKWGMSANYTEAELAHLEEIYERFAQDYRGATSPRIELGLREIAKCWYEREKAIQEGDTNKMKRLTDVINATMSSEALKAEDSKPTEATRIDVVVDRLEKAGAAFDGRLLSPAELGRFLAKWNPRKERSLDMVDTIMLQMYNAMRRNLGAGQVSQLPEAVKGEDLFGELSPQVTEKERETAKKMGIQIQGQPKVTQDPIW